MTTLQETKQDSQPKKDDGEEETVEFEVQICGLHTENNGNDIDKKLFIIAVAENGPTVSIPTTVEQVRKMFPYITIMKDGIPAIYNQDRSVVIPIKPDSAVGRLIFTEINMKMIEAGQNSIKRVNSIRPAHIKEIEVSRQKYHSLNMTLYTSLN